MNDGGDLRILTADDHSIVRQGLGLLIEEIYPKAQVFQTATLKETLAFLDTHSINLLIIDAQFPDGNAIHHLSHIKEIQEKCKILIFTSFEEEVYALKYAEAGADGFLNKVSNEGEIKETLKKILNEGNCFSQSVKEGLILCAKDKSLINPLEKLTCRELQIARLYSNGLGNLEIANELEIKQNTVSTMKKRILDKLAVGNLLELVELMRLYDDF